MNTIKPIQNINTVTPISNGPSTYMGMDHQRNTFFIKGSKVTLNITTESFLLIIDELVNYKPSHRYVNNMYVKRLLNSTHII